MMNMRGRKRLGSSEKHPSFRPAGRPLGQQTRGVKPRTYNPPPPPEKGESQKEPKREKWFDAHEKVVWDECPKGVGVNYGKKRKTRMEPDHRKKGSRFGGNDVPSPSKTKKVHKRGETWPTPPHSL